MIRFGDIIAVVALAIFDLDNTLIDRAGPFRRWAEDFAARHDLQPSEVAWLEAADGDGFAPREAFIDQVRQRYGLDEPVDAMLRSFRTEIVALIEPDPRVAAALDRLREAGWLVAIATNGATDQQWAKIRRTRLDNHVDAVAVSQEVGAKKPDRRMFDVAALRCGASLAETDWMVGDCATRDIGGAKALGLRTVWMRRGRSWDPRTATPDAMADQVPDVVSVLLGT
jgi:HAD superfamily hydrolase (TIGR01549 family)